jgi:hypothetical protein
LLCEHCLKNGAPLIIGSSSSGMDSDGWQTIEYKEFLERYPRTPLEFFDRALENIARMLAHPTDVAVIMHDSWAALFSNKSQDQALRMIDQLKSMGYIYTFSTHQYGMTPKGWQRVRELDHPGRDTKQAFVAMWFDEKHKVYFTDGFKPAIEEDTKWTALRIDRKEHNRKIDDEIIAEIRRSRFVVADFTSHRGGVYFEAGFALGLGIPVIWCVHEDDKDAVHFDTRQYNHIIYSAPDDLRVKLLNRIRATIS